MENCFKVMLCLGIMALYIIGAVVDYFWMNIILAMVPLTSISIFLFMPETPSFLLMHGERSRAESVLQYFRGVKYNVGPEMLMLQVY